MLVDDEELSCVTGVTILEELGYDVKSFTDPQKALKAFEENPQHYQLLMSDYSMPHYTGPEFIREIKAISADTPIVMVTGYSNLVSEENFQEWNCDDFISKPYKMQTISEVISKILTEN